MQHQKIVVIGAGTVGQATGKGLMKNGHDVTFVDTDLKVVKNLRCEGYAAFMPEEVLYDLDLIVTANIFMFCVNTPLTQLDNEFEFTIDLSHLITAIRDFSTWLKRMHNKSHDGPKYSVVVIRSTVLPGTTKGIVLPLVEKFSDLRAGKDFGLCMQPEFLRNMSAEYDFLNPPMIVIGQLDNHSGEILDNVYSKFACDKIRVDLETAEFTKYICNSFNAIKISFSNEMWLLGNKLGIDANDALRLAVKSAEGFWNPSYGSLGGKPYAGKCLPKDMECFISFIKKKGADSRLLSAARDVNRDMERRNVMPPTIGRGTSNSQIKKDVNN